jgi:mono/diheme cytochrome c family protein
MTPPRRWRPGWAGWPTGLALAAVLALPAAGGPDGVTYSRDIAPLLAANCQSCHRDGEIAPFPLTGYDDAYRWRHKLLRNVERRKMPPWPPVPGHGDFEGERRLADADIQRLRAWVQAGAPEGDPRDLPPPRAFPALWSAGPPDVVLEPDASFDVSSADRDLYRCFVIPTAFAEDRYVSVAEYLPGDRRIVHHVIGYVDTSGHGEALDRAEPGPGYTCFGGPGFVARGGLGGWAPGAPPTAMPDGVGMLLPAGARLVMQVHYHNRTGGVVADRTRVGLRFARATVDKRVRVIPVLDRGFLIPAGAERHVVRASYTLPPTWHMHAIGISPHMHLLGRQMRVTVTYPDGTSRPLIYIDDWDFHWQGSYAFRAPVPLPGGSRIDVEAVYDNSPRNRRNPTSPPRAVGWGEGTSDEMCIAFVRVTVDRERLGHQPAYAGPVARQP